MLNFTTPGGKAIWRTKPEDLYYIHFLLLAIYDGHGATDFYIMKLYEANIFQTILELSYKQPSINQKQQ